MKKDIRYQTSCGCDIKYSQTIRKYEGTGRGRICKEHGGKVISRTNICMDCGCVFKLNPLGPGGKRCEPCAKADKALKRKIAYKKRYDMGILPPKKKKVLKDYGRGEYCDGLDLCKIVANSFNCSGCRKFLSVFFHHDPARHYTANV